MILIHTTPHRPVEQNPVELTVTSTVAGETLTNILWTFPDASTATGPTVQHTFPSAGSFAVSLTADSSLSGPVAIQQQVSVLFGMEYSAEDKIFQISGDYDVTSLAPIPQTAVYRDPYDTDGFIVYESAPDSLFRMTDQDGPNLNPNRYLTTGMVFGLGRQKAASTIRAYAGVNAVQAGDEVLLSVESLDADTGGVAGARITVSSADFTLGDPGTVVTSGDGTAVFRLLITGTTLADGAWGTVTVSVESDTFFPVPSDLAPEQISGDPATGYTYTFSAEVALQYFTG